jgi:hypothetical protein
VEAHDAGDVSPAAPELEHHGSPEAVADRCDPAGVDVRVILELFEAGLDALAHQRAVLAVFACFLRCLLRRGRTHALAVDVGCERDKAKLGQHLGPHLDVVAKPVPLVHHQHAGPLALLRIVPGQKAFQDRVALFVLDGFGLDRRLRHRNPAQARQCNNQDQFLDFAHIVLPVLTNDRTRGP